MNMSETDHFPTHALRGELRLNEPMAPHVSWRAGGTARRCYVPADVTDLAQFLKTCPMDEPVYFVGLGSNLLVRDGGLRGTAVLLHGALKRIELTPEGEVYAEAGVGSPKLAKYAGKVLTHRQLLIETWGQAHANEGHYLRVYMGQLRNKLEADPARPRYLVTEHGVGYRLMVE